MRFFKSHVAIRKTNKHANDKHANTLTNKQTNKHPNKQTSMHVALKLLEIAFFLFCFEKANGKPFQRFDPSFVRLSCSTLTQRH